MPTRIKFCGITQLKDAQYAAELGVDALGFVFVEHSPRNISIDQAKYICAQIPASVIRVGLFMNAEESFVSDVITNVHLNLLQFHGEEDEDFCKQFSLPYLKAVPMSSQVSLIDYCSNYPSATGFLLDSHSPGQLGGTGKAFQWDKVSAQLNKPLILAGGLTPENVAEAIRVVRPYGVDVSSGIEASKGVKDPVKMEQFIKEVQNG